MRIAVLGKFPPIQGGVSTATYWAASALAASGHEVHVITNGDEVEAGFRSFLYGEDHAHLGHQAGGHQAGGQHGGGRLTVHRTTPLARFSYIPWAPPFGSQLFGLGRSVIERHGCDLILGWYFEPFAVAAAQLGTALRIPYVVRHAGSDLGRLAEHADLRGCYRWMLEGAAAVLTAGRSEDVQERLLRLGAREEQLRRLAVSRLPSAYTDAGAPLDVESLTARLPEWYRRLPVDAGTADAIAALNAKPFDARLPTIGTYGKAGESKGSFDLLHALAELADGGAQFNFLTIAGGTPGTLAKYYRAILDHPELSARSWILPLVAPWRVSAFIRRCNIVCFLERDFPIGFHAPMIPREILAAGACAVLSAEVADKQPFADSLSDGKNHVRISDPQDHADLARRLRALLSDPQVTRMIGRHGQFLSETCERFFRPANATLDALETIVAAEAPGRAEKDDRLQQQLGYKTSIR